jgi:NADH-quinone oxidoreductase subunit G/[NiFe] hydrogenase diaphorase moiety small subunit
MENIKAGGKFSECTLLSLWQVPVVCLGGGGQPIPTSPGSGKARAKAYMMKISLLTLRKSHENTHVIKLYEEFLTEGPCG